MATEEKRPCTKKMDEALTQLDRLTQQQREFRESMPPPTSKSPPPPKKPPLRLVESSE